MIRNNDDRLQELRDKNIPVYSISRLDCINRCMYEAYLTYVCNKRGRSNIYAILGGKIHDILEGITKGTATEKDLLPAMYQELEDLDMLNIEFPKGKNGEDTIKNNWVADMEHFCKTYKSPQNATLEAEQLFIYKTPGGHYLQGYIDLQRINYDGSIDIYDYKTSSLYKGADIKEHARQLILYALGKEQEGNTVRSVSWIFLKYAKVVFKGKKSARSKEETLISKVIERRNIARELQPYVEGALSKLGMDELDIEIKVTQMLKTNTLPVEVENLFEISPYVLSVNLTEENKQECIEYIDNTIQKWEQIDHTDEDSFPPRQFTKLQKNGNEVQDVFFCTGLCGHYNDCHYIHDFLATYNKEDNDEDDLF